MTNKFQACFQLKQLWQVVLVLTVVLLVHSFGQPGSSIKANSDPSAHPEWTRDANIYEVNIRQYTPEGTFKAFEEHLPRLDSTGVEVLWLMPIHPIGKKSERQTGQLLFHKRLPCGEYQLRNRAGF